MSLVVKLLSPFGWLIRSSTLRLSLLLSCIFAIGMATTVLVALDLGRDAVTRRVDTTLVTIAANTTLEGAARDDAAMILRAPNDLGDLPDEFARAANRGGGDVDLRNNFRRSENWRVLVSEDATGAPIMVALPLDDSTETLELLAGVLWVTAGLVILSTLAIGLGTGLLARRRLVRINDTLDRLAAGDLSARTGRTRSVDDLDDIAARLDVTATELERLVAQTRHLSASLAHDLRTPLARLRAQLEMLPAGEERGAALEEAARLSGIFDTIMRVARIEAAQGRDGFEPVKLEPLIAELVETFGPVIEDSGKRLDVVTKETGTVMADRQMLVQAMANLIQNALVHGGETITLFADGTAMGVADDGPGVDPSQYAEILKPMVRLDAARGSDGTGLGLALVRAVADRHGAGLALSENTPSGLRVTLNFANL